MGYHGLFFLVKGVGPLYRFPMTFISPNSSLHATAKSFSFPRWLSESPKNHWVPQKKRAVEKGFGLQSVMSPLFRKKHLLPSVSKNKQPQLGLNKRHLLCRSSLKKTVRCIHSYPKSPEFCRGIWKITLTFEILSMNHWSYYTSSRVNWTSHSLLAKLTFKDL